VIEDGEEHKVEWHGDEGDGTKSQKGGGHQFDVKGRRANLAYVQKGIAGEKKREPPCFAKIDRDSDKDRTGNKY